MVIREKKKRRRKTMPSIATIRIQRKHNIHCDDVMNNKCTHKFNYSQSISLSIKMVWIVKISMFVVDWSSSRSYRSDWIELTFIIIRFGSRYVPPYYCHHSQYIGCVVVGRLFCYLLQPDNCEIIDLCDFIQFFIHTHILYVYTQFVS